MDRYRLSEKITSKISNLFNIREEYLKTGIGEISKTPNNIANEPEVKYEGYTKVS